jgi:hypothetical protein
VSENVNRSKKQQKQADTQMHMRGEKHVFFSRKEEKMSSGHTLPVID